MSSQPPIAATTPSPSNDATDLLLELPIPEGAEVAQVYPALRRLLEGTGPALLPVPAADPVRTRILRDALRPGKPIDPRVGLVVSTSGSTGLPKGAQLSVAALRASAAATAARLDGPGCWLLALPAHHIAGLQVVLRALAAGQPPIVIDVSAGFAPEALPPAVAALNRAAAGKPTYTSLIPGQLRKVLDHPTRAPQQALASFSAVLLGGAAAPSELLRRASAAGIRIVRTYGSSETAGGCVYDGVPLDGTTVELTEGGRIVLGGPTIALGYRGLPEHPAFAEPGRFRTDDAGQIDDDGRLHVLGRLDAALSVGGLTLLPQVVETALLHHPAVADVVVFGEPDLRLGTRPVAALVLRAGHAMPPEHELADTVRRELGAHAAPARYVVIPEMPRLPGGKTDREHIARQHGHAARAD